jgi:hypothetical protein
MTKFENDNDRINFVDDWNTMVTAVAHFSEKHGLPKVCERALGASSKWTPSGYIDDPVRRRRF